MSLAFASRAHRWSRLLPAILSAALTMPALAATDAPQLAEPHTLLVDASLAPAQAQAQILAARRYATFWTTGDAALEQAALAPDFADRTLPPGRPQGLAGPLAAAKFVHAAVPDIHCDVEQMIVAGDRVVAHLHFTGHFTGQFKGVQGKGQPIDFIATDVYRIADGRIAENWHIEDNLTFLQQLGVVAK
ncbi:ester cyclase [Trinickia fusca]|uniref:Ester cyclase n=1 Tax=Trinickia fusca TaxID=2419777 RepID=A0A494XHV7_9BURK|nr:ester cyclase [Trinickia fusca]